MCGKNETFSSKLISKRDQKVVVILFPFMETVWLAFLPNKLIFDDTLTFMPTQVSLEK